jgi:hypothetical protein
MRNQRLSEVGSVDGVGLNLIIPLKLLTPYTIDKSNSEKLCCAIKKRSKNPNSSF